MLGNPRLPAILVAMPLLWSATLTSRAETTSAPADGVVAAAGGLRLDGADVRHLIAQLPRADQSALSANRDALEQLVRSELVRRALLSDAKAKGFERDSEVNGQLDGLKDELLVRLWVARQAPLPANYPSDEEVKAAYEANKSSLAPPTQYRLAQLFVSAQDGSDSAKLATALRKTADIAAKLPQSDFGQLAQQQSEHALSASKGGDLGYLEENKLLPEIAAAVRNMSVGAVTGPIKTSQGFHFLKLLDKKTPAVPTLAEVRDRVVAALRTRRTAELEQTYLTQLSSRLGVSVNQIALAELQHTLH